MNMLSTINLRALVTCDNGEVKTTSYAVAEAFKKRHSDVLRAIKNMKCSPKFRERNFALCFENNKLQNGKPRKFYQMTKDGWMFLVMGFNGERADTIKEEFIDAFNWMAEQLTQSFQAKWSRLNHLCLYRGNRKQQISICASSMGTWRWEKQPLDDEISKLEMELQPQLPYIEVK